MKMKKVSLAVLAASTTLAVPALAENHEGLPMSGKHAECKKKDFETRLSALEEKASSTGSQWTWGADIEIEGGWGEDFAGEHTSDIVVATAYLSLEAQINKQMTGFISFLYEEDDTPFDLDEAYLDFAANDAVTFRLGQEYIPFGTYNGHLINDPLTQALGEAVETVAQASFSQSGFLATAYVFAGNAPYEEEDRAEDVGMRLQYSMGDTSTGHFMIGADYISNIAESFTLQDFLSEAEVTDLLDNYAGYAVTESYETETWGVNVEHVGTIDAFDSTELAFAGVGAEPSAAMIEGWISTSALLPDSTAALAYHQSDEAVLLGLPESRVALGIAQEMQGGTWSWGVEAFQDTDYSLEDGGTDEKGWGLAAKVAASL